MRNLIAIVTCLVVTSNLFGQLTPRIDTAPLDTNGTILEYDPSNGDFRVYLLPESTKQMTTIEIVSREGIFDGPGAPCLGFTGLFDIYTPGKMFKLDPAGFTEFACEGGARQGLSLEFLTNDLRVDGSFAGGGSLTDAVFLIPEPSGACLFVIGLFFLRRTKASQLKD